MRCMSAAQWVDRRPVLLACEYSLADLNYMPYMTRLDHLQLSPMWDERPRVASWYERMQQRPAYKKAITDWFDYDPTWSALMIANMRRGVADLSSAATSSNSNAFGSSPFTPMSSMRSAF